LPAFPFFEKKLVKTPLGDFELIDGGFCANNPTLYALADVTGPLGKARADVRVVSVGVGEYPPKPPKRFSKLWWATKYDAETVELIQKTMEINTQSMDQLRAIMFKDVPTIRINDSFPEPHMATDLFEHDMKKLNDLFIRGRESYAKVEQDLAKFLI
jgi:hypothetical protein